MALAGIYPVGMKIAAGWFAQGLGWALGVLVGALVVGSAFCAARAGASWSWQAVMLAIAAVTGGGLLMHAFVPRRAALAPAARITPRAGRDLERPRRARLAFGYFGHMWEL